MKRPWKLAGMYGLCGAILLAALVSTVAQQAESVKLEATAIEEQANGRVTGQVLLNDSPVIFFRIAVARLSPLKRAQIVADRLNEVLAAGAQPADFLVYRDKTDWSVRAKGMTIATATRADATDLNTTSEKLARLWRNKVANRMQSLLGGGSAATSASTSGDGARSASRTGTRRPEAVEAAPAVPTGKKIVPIISLGQGLHIGAAQVVGPKFAVDEVRAVAQIEAEMKRAAGARIRAMVPVSTERVVSNLKRVDQVAVSMYGDVDPRRIF